MRTARVWQQITGCRGAVVQDVALEGPDLDAGGGVGTAAVVVVSVRVAKRGRGRCPVCAKRCPFYDRGQGRRRWRALDLGSTLVYLEADAARVSCAVHGVVVAAVPWARHRAGHTRDFDDQVAWMAVAMSKSAVTELMRIAWRTVGAIITRVEADHGAGVDRLAGLRRIGIDEVSYKKGHKYLTVVVDHDTRRLVWAAPGRDMKTLRAFFDALGPARSAALTEVFADAAEWIAAVVSDRAPQARQCADPFHVVAWATDALDVVRRQVWNDARAQVRGVRSGVGRGKAAAAEVSKKLKASRWPLWKNPENLTAGQHVKLAWIAKTSPLLYRAYLLKEALRHAFTIKGEAGKVAIDRFCSWASRSPIPAFVDLGRRIRRHRTRIDATMDTGLSNALTESTNTKIRVLTRVAYGFADPYALIALAMLSLGGARPALPGR